MFRFGYPHFLLCISFVLESKGLLPLHLLFMFNLRFVLHLRYFWFLLFLSDIHKQNRIISLPFCKEIQRRRILIYRFAFYIPYQILLLTSTVQKMYKRALVLRQFQPRCRHVDRPYNPSNHDPLPFSFFEVLASISNFFLSYLFLEITMLIVILIKYPPLLCKCFKRTLSYRSCFFMQFSLIVLPFFIFDVFYSLLIHGL